MGRKSLWKSSLIKNDRICLLFFRILNDEKYLVSFIACSCMCVSLCVPVCVCMCVHACACAHTHTHTHTETNTLYSDGQAKKSIASHLCTVSDFAIEMFDVLDAINYQSYNDFVLRVGEQKHVHRRHTSHTSSPGHVSHPAPPPWCV